MNSIEALTTFFGWYTLLNLGILMLYLLFASLLHEWAGELIAKLFGITSEAAKVTIFRVFQQYRVAFVMLNAVPYFALLIMS